MRPAVSTGPAGQVLVVWEDHRGLSGKESDIYGRFGDDAGRPAGGEFAVAAETGRLERQPAVALGPGEWLVVWAGELGDPDKPPDDNIYGRRVDVWGKHSDEISIGTESGADSRPAVVYNENTDEYLVVWEHLAASGQHEIHGRRVAADGTPIGSVLTIRASAGDAVDPDVSYSYGHVGDNGQFLVSWQEWPSGGSDFDVLAQRVGTDGSLVGLVIAVASGSYDQVAPAIATSHELREYLVVWEHHHGDSGQRSGIRGLRLTSSGTAIGSDFAIAWDGSPNRYRPAVTFNKVAWQYGVVWDHMASPYDTDLWWRRVNADGSLPDVEMMLSGQAAFERGSAIAPIYASPRSLVVWEDGRDEGVTGIDVYGAPANSHLLSGHVYEGAVGDRGLPLSYVYVDLFCSQEPDTLGSWIDGTATRGDDGWYGLPTDPSLQCAYWNVVEEDPWGYVSVGASSVGGLVTAGGWIRYANEDLGKALAGNDFWDTLATATPTATETATETSTPSQMATATPSSTPTTTPTSTSTDTGTPTTSPSPTVTPTGTQPSPTPTQTGTPETPTPTSTPTRTAETPTATASTTVSPSASPSPSVTAGTATATPTTTPTPTTGPGGPGSVTGRVYLERRPSHGGAEVEIAGARATTASNGEFVVPGVPAGTHVVTARHPCYLRASRTVTVVAGQTVALPDVTLLGGDVDQDGQIHARDLVLIAGAWNQRPGDPRWAAARDITGDRLINVTDAIAVKFNWRRAAPGPWPDAAGQR